MRESKGTRENATYSYLQEVMSTSRHTHGNGISIKLPPEPIKVKKPSK
jgi:hypothetical protein